jgi:hypothetical protein
MNGTGKYLKQWRGNVKLKHCKRTLAIVILMSFLTGFPVFGEPLTVPPMSSDGNGTRQYSEYEVDTLIEDLTGAAHEAIEQAAAEAAKATVLANMEHEMALLAEAQRLQGENSRLKQSRVKTAIITGVICFFGGLALGAGTTAILAGR